MAAHPLIERYCIVEGLESANAKMNGKTCLVVCTDKDDKARLSCLFVETLGPKNELVSLTPENLRPLYGVEVKDSAVGGKGLFATQAFAMGDIMFEEHPLLTVSDYEEIDEKLKDLSEAEKLALSPLTLCNDAKFPFKKSEWACRMANNCISCDDGMALYPVMCRANHACLLARTNNVRWAWDRQLKVQYLTASRGIMAGEELFVDYISDTVWGYQRTEALQAHAITGCECLACEPTAAMERHMIAYSEAKKKLSDPKFISTITTDMTKVATVADAGFKALQNMEKTFGVVTSPIASEASSEPEANIVGPFANLQSFLLLNLFQALARIHQANPSIRSPAFSIFITETARRLEVLRLRIVGGNVTHPSLEIVAQVKAVLPKYAALNVAEKPSEAEEHTE